MEIFDMFSIFVYSKREYENTNHVWRKSKGKQSQRTQPQPPWEHFWWGFENIRKIGWRARRVSQVPASGLSWILFPFLKDMTFGYSSSAVGSFFFFLGSSPLLLSSTCSVSWNLHTMLRWWKKKPFHACQTVHFFYLCQAASKSA